MLTACLDPIRTQFPNTEPFESIRPTQAAPYPRTTGNLYLAHTLRVAHPPLCKAQCSVHHQRPLPRKQPAVAPKVIRGASKIIVHPLPGGVEIGNAVVQRATINPAPCVRSRVAGQCAVV